ncbi:MAG: YfiR family protein, partial [Desulfobacterales bacterium]|nr:YfiR family protein [Desulfobacterales bacterium]
MTPCNVKYKSAEKDGSPPGDRRRCAARGSAGSDAARRTGGRTLGRARVRLAAWLLIVALALPAFPGPARTASFQEYQLKAVFLYNFINFITWPDEAFGAPERPFTIGVLGEDPFGSFLEKVVASETFRG